MPLPSGLLITGNFHNNGITNCHYDEQPVPILQESNHSKHNRDKTQPLDFFSFKLHFLWDSFVPRSDFYPIA